MDGRHVQLRQPVITDWASTAAGRDAVTGRVVTPMPGQVTKVGVTCPAHPTSLNSTLSRARANLAAYAWLHASSLLRDVIACGQPLSSVIAADCHTVCARQVFAQNGDKVAEGDAILELSSMKLFYAVNAPCSGVLSGLRVKPGDQVASSQVLCDVIAETDGTQPPSAA